MSQLQTQQLDANIIASLVLNGDLSKLDANQKVQYYRQFCERLGLDPVSQPFKLMKFQGKEVLYCDRGGSQQLSRVHQVSHEIRSRETMNGCYIVTAQAMDMSGRHTESTGAVNIEGLKGEALCNAMMKAETKAKRRATLDLLGLGMLDETETETIPDVQTEAIEIKELPALNDQHPRFNDVVKALKDGISMDAVRTRYTVSPEVEKQLMYIINIPA